MSSTSQVLEPQVGNRIYQDGSTGEPKTPVAGQTCDRVENGLGL
jgi:hypothetical protein